MFLHTIKSKFSLKMTFRRHNPIKFWLAQKYTKVAYVIGNDLMDRKTHGYNCDSRLAEHNNNAKIMLLAIIPLTVGYSISLLILLIILLA